MAARLWLVEDSMTQKSKVKDFFLKRHQDYTHTWFYWFVFHIYRFVFIDSNVPPLFLNNSPFFSHPLPLQEFRATFHQAHFRVIHHSASVRAQGTRTVSDVWLLRCPLTPDCLRGLRWQRVKVTGKWVGRGQGWMGVGSIWWVEKSPRLGAQNPDSPRRLSKCPVWTQVCPPHRRLGGPGGGTGEADVQKVRRSVT